MAGQNQVNPTRRKANQLTALQVRNIQEPGKYHDGGGMGLYLYVKPNGARSWVQRITVNGKRRELGLGWVMQDGWSNLDDDLEVWRWSDRLTVVQAAMLVVEINPGLYEVDGDISAGHFHKIGTGNHINNYFHSPNFSAIFHAIRSAILDGQIAAQVNFLARGKKRYPTDYRGDDVMMQNEGQISYDRMVTVPHPGGDRFQFIPGFDEEGFFVSNEPNWKETTVLVDDLKAWMIRKGRSPKFFFPHEVSSNDDFMDSTHEHFAPELALAVSAWRALQSDRRLPRGVKAAIETWIASNPDAWLHADELSEAAKKRVAILVNWKREGGAPSASG